MASGWLMFTESLVEAKVDQPECLAAAMKLCPDNEFDEFDVDEFDEEYQTIKHHQVLLDIFKVNVMLENILLNQDAVQSFIPEIYDKFEALFDASWDAWKILAGIIGDTEDDEGQIEVAELE